MTLISSPAELAPLVDLTNLNPTATSSDLEKLVAAALAHQVVHLCVSPTKVATARHLLQQAQQQHPQAANIAIATVAGFPSGVHQPLVKAAEARLAVQEGASEIDVVLNRGLLLEDENQALVELVTIREAVPHPVLLKVIIEADQLPDEAVVRAAQLAKMAGADFVKTSTGVFGKATVHHVRLLRQTVGVDLGVKAAGGIRTFAAAQEMVAAGASRIGASSLAIFTP